MTNLDNQIAARCEVLGVEDEDFLVASLIDRCPKVMMLRELFTNAVEAAARTRGRNGRVWLGATNIDGVRKLAIRNSGPGMDRSALRRMSDLASSIGKLKSLSGNFGMGAKVASLPSNHLGVQYRSCADGRVFELIIGKFDGRYGRLIRKAFDGEFADVIEITYAYDSAQRDADWTEVVLYGNSARQDTVTDPYGGDPTVSANWIPQALYHRFFRIPENVDVEIAEGLHWAEGVQSFATLAKRGPAAFGVMDTVVARDGVLIHYFYDPADEERPWENKSSKGALQTSASFAGIVHRNEIFDLRVGSPWIYESPKYGISFATRHVSVLVELPDDHPITADMYRQFLRYAEGDQAHIRLDDFIRDVRDGRPAWLLDIFDEMARKAEPSDDLVSELSNFRSELGVHLYEHVERPEGATEPADAAWTEPELEIVQLTDEQDINDRWLDGRVACYYPETRQLFVNTKYESIDRLASEIRKRALDRGASSHSPDTLAALARVAALEATVGRVARVLLCGLAKASDINRWQRGHIDKAVSPESLSVAAEDWRDLAPRALGALLRSLIAKSRQEAVAAPAVNTNIKRVSAETSGDAISEEGISAPRFRVRKL